MRRREPGAAPGGLTRLQALRVSCGARLGQLEPGVFEPMLGRAVTEVDIAVALARHPRNGGRVTPTRAYQEEAR